MIVPRSIAHFSTGRRPVPVSAIAGKGVDTNVVAAVVKNLPRPIRQQQIACLFGAGVSF